MFKNFVLFFSFVFLFFCKTQIVKKKELEAWNKEIMKSHYVTINDLYLYEYNFKKKEFEKITSNIIIKKTTPVKLELESTDDWLRIRAFDLNNTKKEYLGDVIFYITIQEDSKNIPSDEIKSIIFNFINMNFKN